MTAETFHKKWENYWYYYKWHTLVAVVLVITVAVSVAQCAVKPRTDMTVALVTTRVVTQHAQEQIGQRMAEYLPDLNHDGKTLVDVDNIYIGDEQNKQVQMLDLQAKIAAGQELVFLCDDGAYQYLKKLGVFQKLTALLPDAPVTDEYRVPLSVLKAMKGQSFTDQTDRLFLSLRVFQAKASAADKTNQADAIKLLKNLTANTPVKTTTK